MQTSDILERLTCAVQMFDVARSLRMCCSLVCMAILSAGLPRLSTLTPITLPGIFLLKVLVQAKKPACGPPKPRGTPMRWLLPTTTSTPISPMGFSSSEAIRSVAATMGVSVLVMFGVDIGVSWHHI